MAVARCVHGPSGRPPTPPARGSHARVSDESGSPSLTQGLGGPLRRQGETLAAAASASVSCRQEAPRMPASRAIALSFGVGFGHLKARFEPASELVLVYM